MAAGAFDDGGVPSPEREVKNPPPSPHTDLYVVRRFSEIDNSINKTAYILGSLVKKIDYQTGALDRLSEKLHEIDKQIVALDTKLERSIQDYKDLDGKLDKVRIWVISAGAIVTLAALILPTFIAKSSWFNAPATPAAETGKPARR